MFIMKWQRHWQRMCGEKISGEKICYFNTWQYCFNKIFYQGRNIFVDPTYNIKNDLHYHLDDTTSLWHVAQVSIVVQFVQLQGSS